VRDLRRDVTCTRRGRDQDHRRSAGANARSC